MLFKQDTEVFVLSGMKDPKFLSLELIYVVLLRDFEQVT